jgi:HD-GYP domain-containing protein (c-di-GMP phosphodiesterase class II)
MDLPAEAPSALSLLLELGQAFHSTLEFDPLLVSILKQMQSAARCEGVSIWLLDAEETCLTCTHAIGPEADLLPGAEMPAAQLRRDEQLAQGGSLRLDDVAHDPRAEHGLHPLLRSHARNAVVAPLLARGDWLGAIAVTNKLGAAPFSEADRTLIGALGGHAAVAIQNAQLYARQRHNTDRQRLLEQISHHLQQTLDVDVLIPLVLAEISRAIHSEAESLWLLNGEPGLLICRFATGPEGEAIKRIKVPLGQGIVGLSVMHQEAIILEDAQQDGRFYRAADQQTGFVTRSLLCVPLVRQGRAIGAIEAVNKVGGEFFTPDDLDLLRNIADSAAMAIENARLYTELAASYDSTLDALAAALDLRDRDTEGHSRRVVEYTARLARALDLPEAEILEICRGALIHDIGKIGVPDAILRKPGALAPDERQVIMRHPQEGYEMLLGIPYLKEEIQIVLAHQESWDGSGYPFGLRGAEIPLGARLFAVADTFDALTSNRPYRQSRPMVEASAVIAAESGRQFDPAVVAAFLAIPLEEWQAMRTRVEVEVAKRRSEQAERFQAAKASAR